MSKIIYKVVEHDGGWAYRMGDVYSETFPTHEEAVEAANLVSHEQELGGETGDIEYQDEKGEWHLETSEGDDRPETGVEDTADEGAQR